MAEAASETDAKIIRRNEAVLLGQGVSGGVAVALGALLGALAGLKGVAWPIGALIVLNIAAAIYTLRLPKDTDTDPAERENQRTARRPRPIAPRSSRP